MTFSNIDLTQEEKERLLNNKNKDWIKFRQELHTNIEINNKIDTPQDIDQEVAALTAAITHTRTYQGKEGH